MALAYPVSWLHNSWSFNEHVDTAGAKVNAKQADAAILDEWREFPVFRDLHDPYHLSEGGQLGRVHKGLKVLDLAGRLVTPHTAAQRARGSDRVRALRAAFDPSICTRDSPTTDGAYQLKFTEETEDTTNWPSGLIAMQYWARPARQPEIEERKNSDGSRPFRIVLVAGDPRMYEQTTRTLTLTPAAPTQNAVNLGTEAAVLKAVITMAGAGHASFTITRSGVAFIITLSGMANNDVVTIIMGTSAPYGRGRYITKNGTENAALKTSAASTWLDVPVGTTSFAITNTTNVTSCVLNWYASWA